MSRIRSPSPAMPTTPPGSSSSVVTAVSGAGSNQRRGRSPSFKLERCTCSRTMVPTTPTSMRPLDDHAHVVLLVVHEGIPDRQRLAGWDGVADQAIGVEAALAHHLEPEATVLGDGPRVVG